MAITVVRGGLTTGDFITEQRPYGWRKEVIRYFPEGKVFFTALTSKMLQKELLAEDAKFNWFEKEWAERAGDMKGSGLYLDSNCANAYVSGGVAGDTLFAKSDAHIANLLVAGKVVILRDSDKLPADATAEVTDVVVNGDESIVACKLLTADVGGASPLSGADRLIRIGSAYGEMAELPEAIHIVPTPIYNWSQFFQSSLELSRRAMKTRLRTAGSYEEQKLDALEEITTDIENTFIWGQRYSGVDENNKPKTLTYGLIPVIKAYASANVDDYPTTSEAGFGGKTWEQGGYEWLAKKFAKVFKYGSARKLTFCGTGTIEALERLAYTYGTMNINLEKKTTTFGLAVTEWRTYYGTLVLYTHPLFSHESTNANTMVIFEPQNFRFRYIDDLQFINDPNRTRPQGGRFRVDGVVEGWFADCGLEFRKVKTGGYLTGLGEDHA